MIHEIQLQTKRRDEMLDITAQVEGITVGASQNVIIHEGKLLLGRWQKRWIGKNFRLSKKQNLCQNTWLN